MTSILKAASISALLTAGTAASSYAAFTPTTASFIQVTQPSDIVFTFEGFSAGDTDTMKLVLGLQTIFINQSTMTGTTFVTGPFSAGTYPLELVDSTVPATWYSDPPTMNADGTPHLISTSVFSDFGLGSAPPVPASVYYGWEDRANPGADDDFNDLVFTVAAAPIPEPAALALLGCSVVGLGLVRRRRKAASGDTPVVS